MPRKLNATEERILRLLHNAKTKMTAYQIAKRVELSYPTVSKYCKTLFEAGVLKRDSTKENQEKENKRKKGRKKEIK